MQVHMGNVVHPDWSSQDPNAQENPTNKTYEVKSLMEKLFPLLIHLTYIFSSNGLIVLTLK